MKPNDLNQIKVHLNNISQEQARQARCSERIETALFGDEKAGIKGVVKTQQEHEDYIVKQKAFKNRVLGGFTVLSLLWTVVVLYLKEKFSR